MKQASLKTVQASQLVSLHLFEAIECSHPGLIPPEVFRQLREIVNQ